MQILICDDEIEELEKIEKIISAYSESRKELSIEYKTFQDPFAMLDQIVKFGAPDIALLDICMPNLLGTEVAREIKRINSESTDIIFLTSSPDYALEAYSLRANDYIKKPYTEKHIIETLDRIIESRSLHSYALIKTEKEIQRVDLYTIVYAEIKYGVIEIHLKSGKIIKTRTTLTKFAELFENLEGFTLMGASFYVNLRCVTGMQQDSLEMSSGENLVVPRRLKSEIKDKLFEFYKNESLKKKNCNSCDM